MALLVSTYSNRKRAMSAILSLALLSVSVILLVANFIDIRKSHNRNG